MMPPPSGWVRYYCRIFGDASPADVVGDWKLRGRSREAIGAWLDAVESEAVRVGAARERDVRACHPIALALLSQAARAPRTTPSP
jgi:hypothetical protein